MHVPSCPRPGLRPQACRLPAMRIVFLQGGAQPGRHRGAMALGDGAGNWLLLNLSPAVAQQLHSPGLRAQHSGLGDGKVRAVLLTGAQVEHLGGLLSLHQGAPIDLYATPAVFEALTTGVPVLPVLQHYCGVQWRVVPVAGDRLEAGFQVQGLPGLAFTALAIAAPAPAHLAHDGARQVGDSIALAVHDLATGQRLFCAPGLPQFGSTELAWMAQADCLLLDHPPPGARPAQAQRWREQLRRLPARHKLLLGTGQSEPIDPSWAEQGFHLAHDGLAIEL